MKATSEVGELGGRWPKAASTQLRRSLTTGRLGRQRPDGFGQMSGHKLGEDFRCARATTLA
jgi:hypothetical protein